MITISFITTELTLTAAWILTRICVCGYSGRIDWKREALLLLMLINLAVLLRFAFFPLPLGNGRIIPMEVGLDAIASSRIRLIPFKYMHSYSRKNVLLINVLGNIGMFIPTGILLPFLYPKLDLLWKVAAVCAGMALCIEFMQLFIVGRTTDIDDLILNTAGGIIGYGIQIVICKWRA